MYQALYRKYRPIVFEDVLGQEHISSTLKNQIETGKISHAYLFSGSRGTGKTTTAKILSRAVNCENPINGNPCNKCHSCQTILNSSAIDVIEMDAASNNKVEDARLIIDEVVYTPAELKYKVYIIDEAHMLTTNAFNALLKTLEEPPSHIIFIFATTEPHKFPPTILSRCQRYDFKRISAFDTQKRIKQIIPTQDFKITDDAIELIARVADGSMRDALSILDQCFSLEKNDIQASDIAKITGVSDPKFVYEFASDIVSSNIVGCFSKVKFAYENGFNLEKLIDELVLHFRNVLIAKTLDKKEELSELIMASVDKINIYCSQANELSLERILRYIDILTDAQVSKKFVGNSRLSLEIALTGMLKRPDITDPQGLMELVMELSNRVKRLESSKGKITSIVPESAKEDKLSGEAAKIQAVTKDIVKVEPEEIPEEKFSNSELSEAWNDVLILSSKNALTGFDKIIKGAKVKFENQSVEIYISSDSFHKIAKMNKYDEVISKSFKAVTGDNVLVKLLYKDEGEKDFETDNFDNLMENLQNHKDEIHYI